MAEGTPQVSWKDGKGKGYVCLLLPKPKSVKLRGLQGWDPEGFRALGLGR